MIFSRATLWAICAFAATVVAVGPVQATPTIYNTGELSVDDGLIATGGWDDPDTTLSWVVSYDETTRLWHYQYTLTPVGKPGISHIIIEVSDTFTFENLFSDWSGETEINTYDADSQGGSNPDIPGSVYGIKFETTGDGAIMVSFDSDRVPVWGDFYGKGGNDSAVYNEGFTTNDEDPTALAFSDEIEDHILVPDTTTTTHAPAPGAVLLGGLGASLVTWLRRRRAL